MWVAKARKREGLRCSNTVQRPRRLSWTPWNAVLGARPRRLGWPRASRASARGPPRTPLVGAPQAVSKDRPARPPPPPTPLSMRGIGARARPCHSRTTRLEGSCAHAQPVVLSPRDCEEASPARPRVRTLGHRPQRGEGRAPLAPGGALRSHGPGQQEIAAPHPCKARECHHPASARAPRPSEAGRRHR